MANGLMKGVWDTHSDFGQNLSSDNIDQYLDSIDALRVNFMRDNQEVIAQLQAKIDAQ
jgi:hypothetical protein